MCHVSVLKKKVVFDDIFHKENSIIIILLKYFRLLSAENIEMCLLVVS